MKGLKNILILTQWSFKDPLIQAYTLPYVYIIADQLPKGSRIYLVTFEQKKVRMSDEEKVNIKKQLKEKNIFLIDYSYSPFGIISFLKWIWCVIHLLSIILFRKISFIHAWATTAGSLGYVLSLITGKPLIIDSYEPHAEAMVENQTWSRTGMKFKLLFYLERKLSKHAKVIISATKGMHEYAERKYGVDLKNFFVKPACVDLDKFNIGKRKNSALLKELNIEDKIVCVYAGKFGGIYLTEQVFDFFREAEKFWGDRFKALLLTSHSKNEIYEWASAAKFNKDNLIVRFVPHEIIQDYIGLGDFGITPVKPIPTKRYCTPIKDGEYWALGLPVVITKDISDDSGIIIENNAGAVIDSLDPENYRKAIEKISELLKESDSTRLKRIENLAIQFRNFSIAEKIYSSIYK